MNRKSKPSTKTPETYHHGNLREDLLAAAVKKMRESGVEKLSLRALSRELGVSQSAPFRHFKDKNAILAALAIDGFQRLGLAMATNSNNALDQLSTSGLSYVEFAINNPEVFKLMFGSAIEQPDQFPALKHAAESAYAMLENTIKQGISDGTFADRTPESLAYAAWATVHGLAHLAIEEKGPDLPAEAKLELVKSTLSLFQLGASSPDKKK